MKIWLDDIREAPAGYDWCHSVNEAIKLIKDIEKFNDTMMDYFEDSIVGEWFIKIEVIDCDHDLGDYAKDGGDGIKLIDWLAEHNKFYNIKLHTMNPVGRQNMQREIDRYWPK